MNMKKLIFLSALLVSFIFGCKAQKTQERQVSAYTKLEIGGGVEVIYTNSDTLSLKVSALENEIERVETKFENGILYINNKGVFKGPVNVYLKNNLLNEVLSSGAAKFKTTNVIKAESFSLNASGASSLKVRIQTNSLKSVQSGASNVALNGNTSVFNAELSGASVLASYPLTSSTVNISTTGASKAKVFATDKITANASGASNIKIKGDTREVNAEASPAASIAKIKNETANSGGNDADTTVYNWKGRKIYVVNDKENWHINTNDSNKHESNFKHWRGISVGVNGYMNATGGINLPKSYKYMDLNYSRSFNFQINPIERQFDIVKDYFKIVTGIGLDRHLYELVNKTNLNADSSFTWGKIDSTNQFTYIKNKLRCTYLQVPLLLEFNTSNNPDKTFHVAFGVIGQYLIASRTKQLLEQNKFEIEKVRKDNYNLNPFAAKAHVNVGYRGWTFFAEYSLTPLFERGKGPELYPFTAGLRVIPFG